MPVDYISVEEDDDFNRAPGCTGFFIVIAILVFAALAIYGLIKLIS